MTKVYIYLFTLLFASSGVVQASIGTFFSAAFTDVIDDLKDRIIIIEDEDEDEVKKKNGVSTSLKFAGDGKSVQYKGAWERSNYKNYMMDLYVANGNEQILNILTIQDLENRYSGGGSLSGLTIVEKAQVLQEYVKNTIGVDVSAGLIASDYAIENMLENPGNWRASLNEVSMILSFDEKVKVATHFGGLFGDNYNENPTVDSVEEMISSAASGVAGGKCTNVAYAQGQLLKQMGIDSDDIYIVSGRTVSTGHATLAVVDPDDENNVVKLNYSYNHTSNSVSGGAALGQDTTLPFVGVKTRVYDLDGNPLSQYPTDVGKILNDVTGGKNRLIVPSSAHSLQKVETNGKYGRGTFFTGQTSLNENVYGVAINTKEYEIDASWFKVRFDAGFALVKRDGKLTHVIVDQKAAYLRTRMVFRTNEFKLGKFKYIAKVGTEQGLYLMDTTVGSDTISETSGTNEDYLGEFFAGVESKYRDYRFGATVFSYHDFKNEIDNNDSKTLVFSRAELSARTKHKLAKDIFFDSKLALIMTQFGPTAFLEGTFDFDESELIVSIATQMPLSGDIPVFDEYGTKKVRVKTFKPFKIPKMNYRVNVGAEGNYDFDTNEFNIMTTLSGNLY